MTNENEQDANGKPDPYSEHELRFRNIVQVLDERNAAIERLERDNAELNKALQLKFDAMPSGLSAGQSVLMEKEMLRLGRENQTLRESLGKVKDCLVEMVKFCKPHRDEWMNDESFNQFKEVYDKAKLLTES